MNDPFLIQIEWGHFLMVLIVIIGLYTVIRLASYLMQKVNILGGFQNQLDFKNLKLIFEPLALITLVVTFVMVNPIYHGLIVGIVVAASFSFIKNYFTGRIIQIENPLSLGMKVRINNLQGIISKISGSGLYLRTGKGAHFFSFSQLYSEGFMVLSGEEAGGFYQISLSPMNIDKDANSLLLLSDTLAMAPYVDRNFSPEIIQLNKEKKEDRYRVKVFVKEENHLYDLLSLMRELGFDSKISKK
jgi:hypothetical protein